MLTKAFVAEFSQNPISQLPLGEKPRCANFSLMDSPASPQRLAY